MGAIKKTFSDERSAVLAVIAGADVILIPNSTKVAIDTIEAAIKRGEITEERINQSVRRLLKAKYSLGLTKNRLVDLSKVNALIEKPESVREANSIAERSITLLRNDKDFLPINVETAKRTMFVVIAADDDPVEGQTIIPEILRRVANAKIVKLDRRSTQPDYDRIIADTKAYQNLVLTVFVKRAAEKGTVRLPDMQTAFVREAIALDKNVAVLAFGSPYLIRQFPEVKTYAVTYAIEDVAQFAAAKTLFGEVPFRGKLPVSIPGLFEIGSGMVR